MKILIALPTKAHKEPSLIEAQNYLQRVRSPLLASALFTNPKSIFSGQQRALRIEAEGVELLQKTKGHYRIALCESGPNYSSEHFSLYMEKLAQREHKVAFIIGGAFGLSKKVLDNCEAKLSLSIMTLPHRLAFLVLCEQLFRASEIMRNTPYHK